MYGGEKCANRGKNDTNNTSKTVGGGMARNDRITRERMSHDLSTSARLLSGASPTPPEDSYLRKLADNCLVMADCYVSDAGNFLRSGDAVTAFAAANYACAWLEIGEESGLLTLDRDAAERPVETGAGTGMDTVTDERMARYLDITARARAKIAVAAPDKSFGLRMAEWCLERSDSLYAEASRLASEGDFVDAFATVNRSHAWLDFGARTGLFDVGGDDVLFTLYERRSRGSSTSTCTSSHGPCRGPPTRPPRGPR